MMPVEGVTALKPHEIMDRSHVGPSSRSGMLGRWVCRTILLIALAFLASLSAVAQPKAPISKWSGQISAGYSNPMGIVDELFDGGVSISGGVTYHPRRAPLLGFWSEAGFQDHDLVQSELDAIGVSNGSLRIWSLSGGISLETRGKVGFLASAGVGIYRWQVDLVNPAENNLVLACSDWWDFCVAGIITTQNVVGTVNNRDFGYTGGLGVAFRLKKGRRISVEARYHYVELDTLEPIKLLPIHVGFRW